MALEIKDCRSKRRRAFSTEYGSDLDAPIGDHQ